MGKTFKDSINEGAASNPALAFISSIDEPPAADPKEPQEEDAAEQTDEELTELAALKKTVRSERLHLLITKQTLQQLNDISERAGISRNELLNYFIKDGLERINEKELNK